MDTEIHVQRGKLSLTSTLLLLTSAVIFPFCLLIPFAIRAHTLLLVLAFSRLDGAKPSCISSGSLVAHNQCATWLAPRSIWPLSIVLLGIVLLCSLGLNLYTTRLRRADSRRFVTLRFVTTLVISVASIVVYMFMKDASQSNTSHDFGFVGANLLQHAGPITNGSYVAAQDTRFGYGITPAGLTMLAVAFVLPAFISWYQFVFSRQRVGGQKKTDLFQ